jgi:hypothetical protein
VRGAPLDDISSSSEESTNNGTVIVAKEHEDEEQIFLHDVSLLVVNTSVEGRECGRLRPIIKSFVAGTIVVLGKRVSE